LAESGQVQKAELASSSDADGAGRSDFDRFRDIPIQAAVHLDRRRIEVRQLLGIERDSIIQLERSAGENVDLLLNGTLVGSGEIVVIDDMVGLRITDIVKDKTK